MTDELIQTLTDMVPRDNILENEDMDMHTTFRVGGPAKYLIYVDDEDQLAKLARFLNITGKDYFLLGNGSNLLVSDKGYDGIILKLSGRFNEVRVEGNRIYAGAAALLSQVARCAADNSLAGMEFAAGIPGSLGGAMVMNAGAFDGEMKMITESVTVMNESGELMTLDNDTMEFGYRTSVIKNSKYIVTSAVLKLAEGNKEDILNQINELNAKRREKQPLEYPSAGSTFKRPEGFFAGKLIMDAGLRGFSIGGAGVSNKHCGFVVNKGNASAADVYDVICQVQETIKDKFDVKLEREVILLGDF